LYPETQNGIVGRRLEEIHGAAEEGNHTRRSLSLSLSLSLGSEETKESKPRRLFSKKKMETRV
jgi:hypothetical protein